MTGRRFTHKITEFPHLHFELLSTEYKRSTKWTSRKSSKGSPEAGTNFTEMDAPFGCVERCPITMRVDSRKSGETLLKRDTQAELNLTRAAYDVRHPAGIGIPRPVGTHAAQEDAVVRLRPIWMIGQIEQFGAELNVEGVRDLRHAEVLQQAGIHAGKPWSAQRAAA